MLFNKRINAHKTQVRKDEEAINMKATNHRNTVTSNRNTVLHLIGIGALVLVLCMTMGCAGTLQQITIPEDVTWRNFASGIATPYNDIDILTIGDNINAEIIQAEGPFAYCHNPVTNQGYIEFCSNPNNCAAECDTGEDYLGANYLYEFAVSLDPDNFTAGGVQLVSDAEGPVQSISIAVNSEASALEMTAGVSEGTLPLGSEVAEDIYVIDNGFNLLLFPPDPGFDDGGCFDPNTGLPYILCEDDGVEGTDTIWVAVNQPAGEYSCTCGDIPLSLTLVPPYDSVGDCISDSLAKNCKGVTGRARAACNSMQIGNCHAAFHVPSNHNP